MHILLAIILVVLFLAIFGAYEYFNFKFIQIPIFSVVWAILKELWKWTVNGGWKWLAGVLVIFIISVVRDEKKSKENKV